MRGASSSRGKSSPELKSKSEAKVIEWSEPPVAEQEPGITGQPLGGLPEHAKKRRRGKLPVKQPELNFLPGGRYTARFPDDDPGDLSSTTASEGEQSPFVIQPAQARINKDAKLSELRGSRRNQPVDHSKAVEAKKPEPVALPSSTRKRRSKTQLEPVTRRRSRRLESHEEPEPESDGNSSRWQSSFDASQPTTVKLRLQQGEESDSGHENKNHGASSLPTPGNSKGLMNTDSSNQGSNAKDNTGANAATGKKIKPEIKDTSSEENDRRSSRLKHKEAPSYAEIPPTDDIEMAEKRDALGDDTHPEARGNDDWCSSCGRAGRFICCESCTRSFHFLCLDPPLVESELPDGAWYCRYCLSKKPELSPALAALAQPNDKTTISPLFGDLCSLLKKQNPKEFQLPLEMRTRFVGVGTGPFGDYVTELPYVSKARFRAVDITEAEVRSVEDVALCFKCGLSGFNATKTLMPCARCPTYWHSDCLAAGATPTAPFVCPNHADNIFGTLRPLKKPAIFDPKLHRGYKNDGVIEIDVDDEPEDADMNKSEPDDDEDSPGEDEDNTPVKSISYFDIKETTNGFSALIPWHRRRFAGLHADRAVPKLPSRAIKLDFLEHVHNLYQPPFQPSHEQQLLLALDMVAKEPEKERKAVRDLVYLQLSEAPAVPAVVARQNLEVLVDAALDVENEARYKAIARLCEIKGRSKLLEFLST